MHVRCAFGILSGLACVPGVLVSPLQLFTFDSSNHHTIFLPCFFCCDPHQCLIPVAVDVLAGVMDRARAAAEGHVWTFVDGTDRSFSTTGRERSTQHAEFCVKHAGKIYL